MKSEYFYKAGIPFILLLILICLFGCNFNIKYKYVKHSVVQNTGSKLVIGMKYDEALKLFKESNFTEIETNDDFWISHYANSNEFNNKREFKIHTYQISDNVTLSLIGDYNVISKFDVLFRIYYQNNIMDKFLQSIIEYTVANDMKLKPQDKKNQNNDSNNNTIKFRMKYKDAIKIAESYGLVNTRSFSGFTPISTTGKFNWHGFIINDDSLLLIFGLPLNDTSSELSVSEVYLLENVEKELQDKGKHNFSKVLEKTFTRLDSITLNE